MNVKNGTRKVDLNIFVNSILEKKTRMEAYILATNQLHYMYLTTKKYNELTNTEHNKYHSLSSMGNQYFKKNQKLLDELLSINIESNQKKTARTSYDVSKEIITKMVFDIYDDRDAKNCDKIKCIELLIRLNENQVLDQKEIDNIQSIYNFNINTKKDATE